MYAIRSYYEGAGNSVVDVNLSESEVYLAIGDSYQLTETVLPETAGNKNVSYNFV